MLQVKLLGGGPEESRDRRNTTLAMSFFFGYERNQFRATVFDGAVLFCFAAYCDAAVGRSVHSRADLMWRKACRGNNHTELNFSIVFWSQDREPDEVSVFQRPAQKGCC